MSYRVGVLILPGCVASSALGLMDLLATANRIANTVNDHREPPFQTCLLSMDGNAVHCSPGCRLSVQGALETANGLDMLFIPSFPIGSAEEVPGLLASQKNAIAWLQQKHSELAMIASHCSGNLLLAEAGLLHGHQVTTAWWLADYFQEQYPECRVDTEAVTVLSGPFHTGGSTSAYQDQALWLIEHEGGKHLARLVAKYWMLDNQRQSQAPYQLMAMTEHADPLVDQADRWLRKNLSNPISLSDLARHLQISSRTLIRRFQTSLGRSPLAHLQQLRIERSKMLLETTTLPLSAVSQRCGYTDLSAFRRLFSRYCQLSPREYRRRFATHRPLGSQEAAEKRNGQVSQN